MRVYFAAALIAMYCVPVSATADTSPEKIIVSPSSSQGAVVIRVPTLPVKYAFLFSKDGKSGFGSRAYVMRVQASGIPGTQFIVRTFKPGIYRLDEIFQQKMWGACLHDRTFSFEIKAGEIAFIGLVDPQPTLNALYAQAEARKQTSTGMVSPHTYWTEIPSPTISAHDEAGLKEAEQFVRHTMPLSTASVYLANVTTAAFDVSSSNKSIQVCG